MAYKKFAMSTNVLMGQGVCEQIEAQACFRGANKIMLVTDEGLVKAGLVDKVLAHIDKSKLRLLYLMKSNLIRP